MSDIQQNNNGGTNVPQTPINTPSVPTTPANAPSAPTSDQKIDVTGQQYEVDEVHPEDLDMTWTRLKCLVCNYTYEGMKPIKKCPRCGNEDPDKFSHAD